MDVFALLWVGNWLDQHNENSYLRGILPGWKDSVSSFQSCVIGSEVEENAWGGAILARMSKESDYRAMVSEVCYPRYLGEMARLNPPGDSPPLHMFQEWYAATDAFAEVEYLDMDSIEATHLCEDLVLAGDWLRTASQKLHDTAIPPREIHCGVRRLSSLSGDRLAVPEPISPLDPVWGDVRMPLSRRAPTLKDGVLYADYQETHNSNARVAVRTRNGRAWDVVPYTDALILGPVWDKDSPWGVGRSVDNGPPAVEHFEGGQWTQKASLPLHFRPEVLGGSGNNRVVIGRERSPIGDRFSVVYTDVDGQLRTTPSTLMNCSGAGICYPTFHVSSEGTALAINVEQIGFQLGIETHFLAGPGHRAQSRIVTLRGVKPRTGGSQIDTCFNENNQWVLVNGETLLGSSSGGKQWQQVHHFSEAETFGKVQMACKFGSVALLGPARGVDYPAIVRHTVCNASKRCLPVGMLTEFRARSGSIQLSESGLFLLLELYPQHNLVAYQDPRLTGQAHLTGFASLTDFDQSKELPVRRVENLWYIHSGLVN